MFWIKKWPFEPLNEFTESLSHYGLRKWTPPIVRHGMAFAILGRKCLTLAQR
jgi:hypothetical protein